MDVPASKWRGLGDRLFLASVGLYLAHRGLESRGLSSAFSRAYLNDVLTVPIWAPVLVEGNRLLGWRSSTGPPSVQEVLMLVGVLALTFEFLLPILGWWRHLAYADGWDVVAYLVGGGLSLAWWHRGSAA